LSGAFLCVLTCLLNLYANFTLDLQVRTMMIRRVLVFWSLILAISVQGQELVRENGVSTGVEKSIKNANSTTGVVYALDDWRISLQGTVFSFDEVNSSSLVEPILLASPTLSIGRRWGGSDYIVSGTAGFAQAIRSDGSYTIIGAGVRRDFVDWNFGLFERIVGAELNVQGLFGDSNTIMTGFNGYMTAQVAGFVALGVKGGIGYAAPFVSDTPSVVFNFGLELSFGGGVF